jgi:HlyD family secretion protein
MDRIIEKKKWNSKKIAYAGGGGFIILFLLYIFVFADQSSKLNVEKEKITIATVSKGPFQEFIPITGNVLPIETFYLDVSEGGRVVRKFVEEGAFINEGDPIIKLDNAQLTLNIMYNEAQLFQQINSLRSTRLAMEQNKLNLQGQLLDIEYELLNQKRVFENNKILYSKNLISKNEYEQSVEQYEFLEKRRALTVETHKQDSLFRIQQIEQLEKSVDQMQNNLVLTKAQLENLTVKAPISGQLTALNAEIGESIAPGENLGQIDVIDAFKVRAAIDEHYIARVSPGQQGEFTFAGTVYSVIIKTVYPQVTNGTFQVDMQFNNEPPAGIRRGQTLHIKLELGELSDAVMVDRGGFYQTTGGQWAFVLDKSGNYAERKKIKLGRQNPQSFEVLEGLFPGDKIVTSSYDNYSKVEKLIIK